VKFRLIVSSAALVLVLSACAEDAPTGQSPDPSPPLATPSQSVGPIALGDLAPPDFSGGGLGLWTRERFFKVHKKPDSDSRSSRLKAWNPLGQRLRLLVLKATQLEDGTGWFRVLLPERPNGVSGWIEADPKRLKADRLPDRIEIDLSRFRLEHFRGSKLVQRATVAIGEDRYPTPTGTFYVWASVPQPDPAGPYGRFALGLSGFSPVLSDWPGGGRAAIHGTADASDKGEPVSHGCIRVYNKDMKELEKVPLGTPVLIRN
jgi:hypothetical protein